MQDRIPIQDRITKQIIENNEEYLNNIINNIILQQNLNSDFIKENININNLRFHYWFYGELIKYDKVNLLKKCHDKIKTIISYLTHIATMCDSLECFKYLINIFMKDSIQYTVKFIAECFIFDSVKCFQYLNDKIDYKEQIYYLKLQLDTNYYPVNILKYLVEKERENLSQELIFIISIYYKKINLDDKFWRDALFNIEFDVNIEYKGVVDRLKTVVKYKKNIVNEMRKEVKDVVLTIANKENEWLHIIPKDVLENCLLEYI